MTYKVNGTDIVIQPSDGGWIPRESIGIDGNGHPIYPPTREFEMSWVLMSATGFYQLQNWYNSVSVTGSAIVDLPKFASGGWEFRSYTGCVLHEPEMDSFFEQYQPIKMRVTNIRV